MPVYLNQKKMVRDGFWLVSGRTFGASAVKIVRLEGDPPKEEIEHKDEKGGFFVGSVWDGSFHDPQYEGPFVFSFVYGRKKRLPRLNRLFREAKDRLAEVVEREDPCTKRFKIRSLVREGD